MLYGSQPVSHALSAMAIPLALIVIAWYWTLSADPVSLIRAVAPLIVAALCVNTVAEVAQVSAGKAALGVLPRFWATAGQAHTVAALAAQNGRYTGIFDQPAEAGIAYGVALLCLIWQARLGLRPSLVTGGAVLVIAGGVLTLSKVFLLGALPVAVVTVLRGRSRVRAAATAAAAAGGVWLTGAAGLLPAWHLGSQALGSLLDPRVSLTAQYTAGRYGTGSTLGPAVADVLHAAGWSGFGAGGINVPYDSLWLEVLAVSGVLGVTFAAVFLAGLVWRWVHLRARLGRPEWHLAGGVLALALGASAGLPSLTANRAGTLLWLILGVLLTARAASRLPHRDGPVQLIPCAGTSVVAERDRGPGAGSRVRRCDMAKARVTLMMPPVFAVHGRAESRFAPRSACRR
jgi:hypothetical protein